jgi:cobalt-zinc-cadmium efflux system protein
MQHQTLRHLHGQPDASKAKSFGAAFAIGGILNLALVAAEIGFGFLSNSVALISDGVHNATDVLGLIFSWIGAWLSARRPSIRRTYGFRRASILAALANAALLFVATGAILIEAFRRLAGGQPVSTGTVLWVAGAAIGINAITAMLFARGRKQDVNIGSVFVHMAADTALSLGVVIAALLIGWTGWLWLDPAMSILIAAVILASSWRVMRDSFNLALDAVPPGISPRDVESYLAGLPGISEVHDLQIWAMSATETALTAHVVRPRVALDDRFLTVVAHELEHRFGIRHATIQIESGEQECPPWPR